MSRLRVDSDGDSMGGEHRMSESDVGKRIPNAIGTGTYAIGTYTLTDLAVGSLPGILVILLLQFFVSPATTVAGYRVTAMTLPLAGLAMAGGALIVFLTPDHLTTAQWLGMAVGFQTRSTRLPHDATVEQTQVEAMYPDEGVIERTDGALVGFLQVTPPPMALATDDEWARKSGDFREFLNTVIDFPIQVYSTTQPFPVESYLDQFESRRTDPDVQSNPQLARLLDEYVSWYRRQHSRQGMTTRDHYVIVAVTPSEVRFEREGVWRSLASLPALGRIVEWVAPRRDAMRAAMFDAIDERLARVKRGLDGIEGCDAHRLEVTEAVELIATFWKGEPVRYGEPERVVSPRWLNRGQR